ncbi:hypothetical protein [Frisingicoccus sp.]|uniref:hypothetical protein n=1 Tax=Frisingicoccus sp. TaxID=1918627 RepID=UPI003AB8ADFC
MKLKKPLIAAISAAAALAVAAAGIGGYRIYKNANTQVEVTPVSILSIPYWGEENASSGFVTTDMTQDVYVTEEQVIQEILVKEGDVVSVGTPLMKLDNTLAALDLEMQALAIDTIDIQIAAVDRDIRLLKDAAVRQPGAGDVDILMKPNTPQIVSSPNKGGANPDAIVARLDQRTVLFLKDGMKNVYTVKCSPETIITPEFLYRIIGIDMETGRKNGEPIVVFLQIPSIGRRIYLDGYTYQIPADFYEMTLDTFMNTYDVSISETAPESENTINPFNGITAEERDKQLKEKEKQQKTLGIDRKEAVLKYEKMRKDVSDGTILSTVNGEVKAVGSPESGMDFSLPFITVTSQDGFYLKGTINELRRDELRIGQKVSVTNMETGMMTEAEVTSVSDYPVSDNAQAYGTNPNTSNYPFTAVLTDAGGFKNNQPVNVSITADAGLSSQALYIPKAYVREDNGEYYVFIADEKGRLKKQVIDAGATLYGYYQEIRSGLTAEDLIAFPYGKAVKEGVKTKETDSPAMY